MTRQINLFSADLKPRRPWLTSMTMVLGLLVVLLGMGGVFLYYQVAVQQIRTAAVAAETEAQGWREQLEHLQTRSEQRRQDENLAGELANLERQLASRRQAANLVVGKETVGGGGFSGYLAALARQASPRLWLTQIEVDGASGDMRLTGAALDGDAIPAYIRGLEGEDRFSGREFTALRIKQPPKLQEATPVGGEASPQPLPPHVVFELTGDLPEPEKGKESKLPSGGAAS